MDEVDCFMDWDLEAIVRGGFPSINQAPTYSTIFNMEDFFSQVQDDDDMLFNFPEFSETTRVFDELKVLYKPFYPVFHTLSPQNTIVTTSLPNPQEELIKPSQKVVPQDLQLIPTASKSKKRKKSVNKRVTKEVKAEDIGVSDAWAWRKYGQKPIKGSPYPRSYYKCSTSKGCLARKQVERSNSDPGVFLVTYTAEHSNHPQPTRRNSLAGSTRKNSSIVAPATQSATCSSNSSAATASLSSPRTSMVVQSMEEDEINVTREQQISEEGLMMKKLEEDLGDAWFPTDFMNGF